MIVPKVMRRVVPIRVSFFIDQLSRAGTESQLLALLRVLDRRRVEPTLILLNGSAAESQSLEPSDCEVIRLGVTRLVSRAAWAAARRLGQLWHRRRPHIVQSYFLDSTYFALPLARWQGVPKLVRVRNNLGYWLTPRHRLLNRVMSLLADVTLTNSEAGAAELRRTEFLPASRLQVLANGVDLDRFPNSRPPLSGPVITLGCVANLRPVKNLDGLLHAFAQLQQQWHGPPCQLRIAGEGSERPRLEQLAQALKLGESVTFLGSVADVPAFLDSVDLAVLPSHSEGMSNAVLEYMAAGRAIVATDVGANAALLQGCGVVVPAGNMAAFTRAIMEMLHDRAEAQRLGFAARAKVEAEFSRAAMARRFEAFYERLLSQRG